LQSNNGSGFEASGLRSGVLELGKFFIGKAPEWDEELHFSSRISATVHMVQKRSQSVLESGLAPFRIECAEASWRPELI